MGKGNKVVAIVFSDLHLEKWQRFNEHNRRLNNAKDVMKRIALVTKKYNAVSIFTGDLFHKERGISNELLQETLPFFSKIWSSGKFKTYAITGNHDQSQQNTPDNVSPSYIRTLSNTFKGIECIDNQSVDFGTWELFGVPYYTHDLGLIDAINAFLLDNNKVNILALHTTMPHAKDTDGREINSNLSEKAFYKAISRFDIVLVGHIHKPHTYDVLKTKVVQVGAPQQQRFTDRENDMGYWLIYDNFEVEFKPFKHYPKFIELQPGEKRPDNKNFYVQAKAKKKSKAIEVKHKFGGISRSKLAKNYCKEKGITDKKKIKALEKTLKNTND